VAREAKVDCFPTPHKSHVAEINANDSHSTLQTFGRALGITVNLTENLVDDLCLLIVCSQAWGEDAKKWGKKH